MIEQWKKVDGYEFYEVSSLGNVRSLTHEEIIKGRWGGLIKRIQVGRTLKHRKSPRKAGPNVEPTVYLTVVLPKKYAYIHRLVAEAFVPNPNNYPQVNHKNGNKLDNRAENLEWVTLQMNIAHALQNDLIRKGERHQFAKLKKEDVYFLREWFKQKPRFRRPKISELAKKFNCSTSTIYDTAKGKMYYCYE